MGIVIHPEPDMPNINITDLPNYSSIESAFAHCMYPGLFLQLGIPDPYSAWPYNQTYWDTLFKTLRPDGFPVIWEQAPPNSLCQGVDGATDGKNYISIFDCTDEATIFHEIGHIVMGGGILAGFPPLSYRYTDRNGNIRDAVADLNRLFGKGPNNTIDSDGIQFGFVSDYATTNAKEDFAETFKFFVYYSSALWEKASRQVRQGDLTLGDKAVYVAYLFSNMWFNDDGVVGGWLGYSID